MGESPGFPPNVALFVSIVAVSTASILIRMSDAGPLAIAAYRLTFSTLILLPFFLHSGGLRRLIGSSMRDALTLVGVGVVLALHFASWITSLSFTSVASSVIFVHVDPIFVAAISHFVLKEKISKGTLLGIVVAFVGATVIAVGDSGLGEVNLYGDLLALIGAIMLGLYILSGRRLRQSLDLVSYVTPVYATSAVVLTIGSVVSGTRLAPFPLREYALFLAIAVVPMIFGHTVYNWALRYVEAPVVSISLLGEPVGATILAYFVLHEVPTALTLIGGVVTLIGIYQCVRSSN
ncbi:MAG: DMT family transporter [Candidatus Bathyarchaeota archaeon]|nr:DMT family transporter [Candidatus Bathyarchaeota archaeon]